MGAPLAVPARYHAIHGSHRPGRRPAASVRATRAAPARLAGATGRLRVGPGARVGATRAGREGTSGMGSTARTPRPAGLGTAARDPAATWLGAARLGPAASAAPGQAPGRLGRGRGGGAAGGGPGR